MEYRKAPRRQRAVGRSPWFRFRRDEGQAAAFESLGLLSVVALVAAIVGLAVALSLPTMFSDFCTHIRC